MSKLQRLWDYMTGVTFRCSKCGFVTRESEYQGITNDPKRTAQFGMVMHRCRPKVMT